jgi:hypothetical protein
VGIANEPFEELRERDAKKTAGFRRREDLTQGRQGRLAIPEASEPRPVVKEEDRSRAKTLFEASGDGFSVA